MATLHNKNKVYLIIFGLLLILGIAFFTIYSTGIIPSQTRGLQLPKTEQKCLQCNNPNCACHKRDGSCTCSEEASCCEQTPQKESTNSIF